MKDIICAAIYVTLVGMIGITLALKVDAEKKVSDLEKVIYQQNAELANLDYQLNMCKTLYRGL